MAIDYEEMGRRLAAAERLVARLEMLESLADNAAIRGAFDPRRVAKTATDGRSDEWFRHMKRLAEARGEYVKHSEIAEEFGCTRNAAQKRCQSFYRLAGIDSDGREIVLIDANNIVYGNDGVAFRFDGARQFSEAVLSSAIDTNEKAFLRHNENTFTAYAMLLRIQHLEREARRRIRERARGMERAIAQMLLPIFKTGTNDAE